MWNVLLIIGSIVIVIFGVLVYLANERRPKFFTGKLKALEKCLFKELEEKLPNQAGALIPKQLAMLPHGVRLYFEKSYTLELYERSLEKIPDTILFNRKDEFKLATISFTHKGITYTATFNSCAGRVWGVKVRPNPRNILSQASITVDKFKLHNDPTEQLDLEVVDEFYSDEKLFTGILKELHQRHALTHVKKPLSVKQRQLFVRLKETNLPTDLVDLLGQSNGFHIGEIEVLGLGDTESFTMYDGDYWKLAESGTGCLAIKRSKTKTSLKYFSYEDEMDVRALGEKFTEALTAFIEIK